MIYNYTLDAHYRLIHNWKYQKEKVTVDGINFTDEGWVVADVEGRAPTVLSTLTPCSMQMYAVFLLSYTVYVNNYDYMTNHALIFYHFGMYSISI